MGGNRFWEFYLVRYLLGTIFGIVILFYLIINYDAAITKAFYPDPKCQSVKSDVYNLLFSTTYGLEGRGANEILKIIGSDDLIDRQNESIEIKVTGFPILAAIILAVSGFLYMYFSSMLILILHGIRSLVFFYPIKPTWKYFAHCLLAIFFMLVIWIFSPMIIDNQYEKHWGTGKHLISLTVLSGFFVLLMFTFSFIQQFYEQLSASRTKDNQEAPRKYHSFRMRVNRGEMYVQKRNFSKENKQSQSEDYVESYKHLREHGNAFGIIVCEILFAFWLISWDFEFWAILYWCLFGFMAWFLGSYLEIKKVDNDRFT
ncbi:hypothetical protein BAG01nite_35150 [Brevibacillus agri]|uniref:Uncharacterized protein n=1 Tax=Brevibacillus agri TaxID=51101 RepID=A0A3M8B6W9_9BACL|nr:MULTISPECIES: hypothetical protein [Brevibacillus]ELK42496.1 hypothetical protein D478_08388 [Brevibacillus agri BAB-2500]EJL46450.1 hypothetical protein PMI08_01159 [Brevibacillus sp. CF112]MBY0054331.1 hypothetical protein [Brevibacillus agri]MDN4095487.1 hypothetical protein [Brevibacillus agri]MED1822246.1 hypothetical protein [Brevibacillus agri]